MRKLIASDLDGTILNDNTELTSETVLTIKDFVNSGNIFAIATGRSYCGAKPFADMFDFNIPMICFNGGYILFSKTKEVISSSSLEDNIANTIKNDLLDIDAKFILWINDDLYLSKECEETLFYARRNQPNYKTLNKDIYLNKISKILWIDEPFTNNERKSFLEKYLNINVVLSTPKYLEVLPMDVSKGQGLEKLSKYLNINKENIIALGDQENDISMLQYAGLGVTPSNGTINAKKSANYIAKSSNNENLIKEVINKFVNGKE